MSNAIALTKRKRSGRFFIPERLKKENKNVGVGCLNGKIKQELSTHRPFVLYVVLIA